MKNTKSKIIVVMCVALLIMVTGYAYFATNLDITATGNITTNWSVKFISITSGSNGGTGASNAITPSHTDTTATMSVNLTVPGDYMEYDLVLKNTGNIDAIIESIDANASGSPAIIFSISGINEGDKLTENETRTIKIKIEYDYYVTSQPSDTTKTLTVSIKAVQDTGQGITEEAPSINQPMYLSSAILKNNVAQSDANIDFSQTSEATGTNGLYYTNTNTENNGTTYYFRGAVDNNYVKFGKIDGCAYKGERVLYIDTNGGGMNDNPTEEQCLSSIQVCDLGDVDEELKNALGIVQRYVIGIDAETCVSAGGTLESAGSCQYNGKPVVYGDLNTNEINDNPAEEQCLSTTVCDTGTLLKEATGMDYRYVTGVDDATCSYMGGMPTGQKPTYDKEKGITYGKVIDRLWRIVRINEDGSVRIITQDMIGESAFNEESDDNAYVGYMYGTAGSSTYALTHANTNDSTIKDYLDEWYIENLSSYSSYLADAGFCNDRSVAPSAGLWYSNDTALGYAKNYTVYGAYNRLVNDKQPQFACPNANNDLFTTSTSSKGNKALTYPIGLITVDEVAYAGAIYANANLDIYLTLTGVHIWTMSPNNSFGNSSGWHASGSDTPLGESVSREYDVRPVVNLQSGVEIISGDGTFENPYIIK